MSQSATDETYVRRLGMRDAAMIVVGGIIGGGIFSIPASRRNGPPQA